MGAEKRTQARRNLIYYLKVVDAISGEELGRVGNLTTNGVLVIGDREIEEGEVHTVKIDISDVDTGIEDEYIMMKISACWSRPDINPDYFVTGYKSELRDDESREIIERLIDSIGFNG